MAPPMYEEIKYLLSLCNHLTDEIQDEIISYFHDEPNTKRSSKLSDQCVEFIQKNLSVHPVAVMQVIHGIKNSKYYNIIENEESLRRVMVEELVVMLESLNGIPDTSTKHIVDCCLSIISEWDFSTYDNETIERIISKLYTIKSAGNGKELYLSILCQNTDRMMTGLINYEIKNRQRATWPPGPDSVIESCFVFKEHWLLEHVSNYISTLEHDGDLPIMSDKSVQKMWQLALIHYMNLPKKTWLVNFERLKSFISLLDYQNCENGLFVYFNEICRKLNLLSFCKNNSKRKYLIDEMKNQSALSILSQTCDLSRLDRFKVKQLLNMNTDFLLKTDEGKDKYEKFKNWDIMTYNAYCIMTTIIDVIIENCQRDDSDDGPANDFEEIKLMISNLRPVSFRIQVLQDVFACLFLRHEYFAGDDNYEYAGSDTYSERSNGNNTFDAGRQGFVCDSKSVVKDVLNLLKDCLKALHDDLKINCDEMSFSNINMNDLTTLTSHVSHALWKWDIITSIQIQNWELHVNSSLFSNCLIESSSDEEGVYGRVVRNRRRKIKFKKKNSKSFPECSFDVSDLTKKRKVGEPDFVSLMLSSPDTMVALALDSNDYQKAYKIIESYDFPESNISAEISFGERFSSITTDMKKTMEKGPNEWNSEELEKRRPVNDIFEDFLTLCNTLPSNQYADLIQVFPHLQIYESTKAPIVAIVDLLMATGANRNTINNIMDVIETKYYEYDLEAFKTVGKKFYVKFLSDSVAMFNDSYENNSDDLKNGGVCDILTNDKFPVFCDDLFKLNQQLSAVNHLYKNIGSGGRMISKSDCGKLVESVARLRESILSVAVDGHRLPTNHLYIDYLGSFFDYVSNLSTFYDLTSDKQSDAHSFDLQMLKFDIHLIIGFLTQKKNVPLDEMEPVSRIIGINLIHKVVLNLCTAIRCTPTEMFDDFEIFGDLFEIVENQHVEKISDDDDEDDNVVTTNIPNQDVINYVLVHNWIIANLLKKIHSDPHEHALQQSLDSRTRYLDLFLQEGRFNILKNMYGNNKSIAALQTDYDVHKLHLYIKNLLIEGRFAECSQVFNALPERMVFRKTLTSLRDRVLLKLSTTKDADNWKHFSMVKNNELRTGFLFEYLRFWPYEGAMEVLRQFTHQFSLLSDEQKEEGKKWLNTLPIYEKISRLIGNLSWIDVYMSSNENPEFILNSLLDRCEYELCLQWSNLHDVSENVKHLIMSNFLGQIFRNSAEVSTVSLQNLLFEIPANKAVELCKTHLYQLRNLKTMKTVLKFLTQNSKNPSEYENTRIGVQFLSEMEPGERVFFWDLISKPLLIVEQYLMNAKFEKLSKILKKVKPFLKADPEADALNYDLSKINTITISTNAVDTLLRVYAAKALDLKCGKVSGALPAYKQTEVLLQSIDSINLVGTSNIFALPDQVPSKENWVPDNYSDYCMICAKTIFSVLIRRHHCRRCGRLVCYACSKHRILIEDVYADVKVRVCDFCYARSRDKSEVDVHDKALTQTGSSSVKSDTPSMEWCLTANPHHDNEIRREFVYEFSPSVNLCLSIMKMHSINLEYPRFLLSKAAELLKLIGTTNDGVIELIQMRRTLLVSCAVVYARPLPALSMDMMENEMSRTERQLVTTDTMAHLATHGCQQIMPDTDAFDPHYIRRLLKAEKWELALEISTKFNMYKTGVLAAWGKACIKGGSFNMARQKFAMCFNSIPSMTASVSMSDSTDNVNSDKKSSYRRRSDMSSSTSTKIDPYRVKNTSGLLDEIVALLETNIYSMNPNMLKRVDTIMEQVESVATMTKKIKTIEPAININHALNSVSNIKKGDFMDFVTTQRYIKKNKNSIVKKSTKDNEKYEFKQKLEPFIYDECLYYLTSYGSPGAIINFYLKYGNTNDALKYCIEQRVDKEIFTENIFSKYFVRNSTDELLKIMSEIDPTWNIWTDYLMYACGVLEKKGLLEALLAIQTGIGDHVRAAMTCVNLYTKPTQHPHVTTLHMRGHYLAQAKGHLQHMPRRSSFKGDNTFKNSIKTLHYKMDSISLDAHMTTVNRQLDVIVHLHVCEKNLMLTDKNLSEIIAFIPKSADNRYTFPTLFGGKVQRIHVAVLLMAFCKDIAEAFCLANKIIKEHNLDAFTVYNCTLRYIIHKDRFEDAVRLCDMIKDLYPENINMSDSLLESCVVATVQRCDARNRLFDEVAQMFISKIVDISVQISCYIECRLLKTAYLLAEQHDNVIELKRIMKAAEKLGQTAVKNSCVKKLSQSNKTKQPSD